MHIGWKIAGAAALGIGATVALAACTGPGKGGGTDDGPMGELSTGLIKTLVPSWRSGGLDVATQGVREIREGSAVIVKVDGTRLLQAADEHRFGTPTIGDPAVDVARDGTATFNEVRHVVRHYDSNADGTFQNAERAAFEREVGITWEAQ